MFKNSTFISKTKKYVIVELSSVRQWYAVNFLIRGDWMLQEEFYAFFQKQGQSWGEALICFSLIACYF